MISRRVSLTLAAVAGLGLVIGRGADAQIIVQTFTVPSTAVPWNPPVGFNFTYNLFNSTLGVLDSVTLQLATSITAEVDVFNETGTGPQTFTNATASIPVTITAPDGITGSATGVAGPISGTALPGFNAFPGLPANANNTQNIPMADWLGFYEGVGMSTGIINASSLAGTYSGTSVSGVGFGGSAVASATITLTYVYQIAGTIPEPGATTFLAAGVLGSMGMIVRRRRRK